MKARLRWLIVLLVLLAGLSSAGVARAEPCLLSALPPTGQSTTDWYLFVEFTSPEYVLVSFGPWSFGSLDEAKKNLTPPTEDFKKRIRAIGKVKVVGIYLDQLIPEGAYLPIYTPQQFAQFDGSNGLSLPGMTSDLAAVTNGEPPQINKPTEGQLFEIKLGKEWSFRIQATDPEGDPLYYELVAFSYPPDMHIWDANGLIRWKPISSDLLGQHRVVIVVSDTPWPYTCQVRRTFYVNVVAPLANPPVTTPPVTTPPTNNPPVVTPPVITPPTITPAPENNNQGNQGNQGGQGPPAGGGQANPTGPVETGAGQGTGTANQPVSDPGNNNLGPVEVPVSGNGPETEVVIPLEPDGGEPNTGENPPPSEPAPPDTNNTDSDAADLQEIQRQLDEIQNRVNELEDEVTRVLGDSSTIKPAEPASLGLLEIPPGFRFEQDLRRGDKSDDVKYLQILLNSDPDTRLVDSGPGSPGSETRNFGDKTYDAVIHFQEKYAEEILHPIHYSHGTGFVGWRTREKLNRILESRYIPPLETGGNAVPILPVVEPEDVLKALNTLNTATAILPTKAAGKFVLVKITSLLKETAIALGRKDLPKVKQLVDEAVEWASKTFKQAPKLTSTQQATYGKVVNDASKMKHIFGNPEHKLQPLVDRLGSRERVVEEVVRNLGKVGPSKFEVKRNIAGFDMIIRGNIVDDIPRISDFWVPL